MSDSKDAAKPGLRVQTTNLRENSALIKNAIVDIVKKYAEEVKAQITAKQKDAPTVEQYKLLKTHMEAFSKSLNKKIQSRLRSIDDDDDSAPIEEEPVDQKLKSEHDELHNKLLQSTQRLERLRADVPAFVKKVIGELYQPIAAGDSSASSSSAAAEELDLDDMPSKKEVERLQQLHRDIEQEMAELQQLLPEQLASTRNMKEVLQQSSSSSNSSALERLMSQPDSLASADGDDEDEDEEMVAASSDPADEKSSSGSSRANSGSANKRGRGRRKSGTPRKAGQSGSGSNASGSSSSSADAANGAPRTRHSTGKAASASATKGAARNAAKPY